MIQQKQLNTVKYLLSLPEDFDSEQKYPLVVFLHGAGTRSTGFELLLKNANFLNLRKRQSRGYILLAPLCSVNNWNEVMSTLIALVESVREEPYVDEKRVYLTGNSMGLRHLGTVHPAAGVVCGHHACLRRRHPLDDPHPGGCTCAGLPRPVR